MIVAIHNKWQLKFNISKCYLLHLGKSHRYGEYNIQGIAIISTDTIKDLGVIIDNNLKFHAHTESVTFKANRTFAIIRKTFKFTDNHMFITLYKTLVRPVIEYANSVWGPHYILDQQNIEKIQQRATMSLTGFQDMSCSDCLHALCLPSLKINDLEEI